jgi:hypothetical protein
VYVLLIGGYTEGELVAVPPRRQNPHMHMLEGKMKAAFFSVPFGTAPFNIMVPVSPSVSDEL